MDSRDPGVKRKVKITKNESHQRFHNPTVVQAQPINSCQSKLSQIHMSSKQSMEYYYLHIVISKLTQVSTRNRSQFLVYWCTRNLLNQN